MTGMPERRARGGSVRADIVETEVTTVPGEPAVVSVEITNLDQVIRSYRVEVLGLDPQWVRTDEPVVDLFPDERRSVVLTIVLPDTYAAGRRRIGVQVSDRAGVDAAAAVASFDLLVAGRDGLRLGVEPESQEIGKRGSFVLAITNTGNTTLDVDLTAEEPERKVRASFDPPTNHLVPGQRCLVDAEVVGERPWFGMPVVRALQVRARGRDAVAEAPAIVIQQPRISRRMLALLGLLLVVTLFAFVIMQSFSLVADRAEANEQLLKQGLGEDRPVGPRAEPALIAGSVASTTAGPIDGATIELFDVSNPVFPAHATVTGVDGGYRFASLPEGTFALRVAAAGFGEVWFPDAATIGDAQQFELEPGTQVPDLDILLEGAPGSVSGTVVGADVEGALVTVEIPGEAIEGSDLEPTPAVVSAVEVDATGEFLLPDLATPATYELLVTKEGYAPERQSVTLRPGEQREDIQVLLRTGDGRLAGTVVDTSGDPLPNVEIDATDGSTTSQTRTLSGEDTSGTFELRDLPTPGTYTLTAIAEGYFEESVTVQLDEDQQVDDLTIVMTADAGSLAGQVTAPDGTPLGGVDVVVDGAEQEFTTVTVSEGDVGTWLVTGLPVPGEYTVPFSQPGRATQALAVELLSGAQADRGGVDVVLPRANASVRGIVIDPDGEPISGVAISLESADIERVTRSSDRPPGAYRFDDLPPGAYTLTYDRAGSQSQTLLVDLQPGEDRELAPIELESLAGITGRVSRDGVGEAGVGVVVYRFDTFPDEMVAETETTAGGDFEILGLDAPAQYIVEFRIPAGGQVAGSRTVFVEPGELVELEIDDL